jgi:two-component system, OmpR family, phosphate regulon sensor histidine kinase PhoR
VDKRNFSFFITVSAIALAGIMIIQLYGIRNVIKYQKEQFHGNVRISLNAVVNHLLEIQLDTNQRRLQTCKHAMEFERLELLELFQQQKIQTLLDEEFQHAGLNFDFAWAIYDYPDKEIIISNNTFNDAVLEWAHYVALNCFQQSKGYRLAVHTPREKLAIIRGVVFWAVVLFLLIFLLIVSFYRIILMFLNQKKLSEMKTDFVNNMTHEFKTPIASVSLAADMLMRTDISNQPCQVQRYAKVISDENTRLKNRVEQVLHLTMMERGDFSMKMQPVDLHKIIDDSLKPYKLLIKKQKGMINKKLKAGKSMMMGDAGHLESIVSNLVDNAIKYSIGAPEITLETSSSNVGITLFVEDRGIGIRPEDQENVFRRFYRVPTGDIHNAKGFGLGLYYVKTVVEAHHGKITLSSQPGKGSRFGVFLPFDHQKV